MLVGSDKIDGGSGDAGGADDVCTCCCCLCYHGDSCSDDNNFFCNEREEGFYDGEEAEKKETEEEIKQNQKETKGIRSGVRRTKDEAADNVVVFVGFGAKFCNNERTF